MNIPRSGTTKLTETITAVTGTSVSTGSVAFLLGTTVLGFATAGVNSAILRHREFVNSTAAVVVATTATIVATITTLTATPASVFATLLLLGR